MWAVESLSIPLPSSSRGRIICKGVFSRAFNPTYPDLLDWRGLLWEKQPPTYSRPDPQCCGIGCGRISVGLFA